MFQLSGVYCIGTAYFADDMHVNGAVGVEAVAELIKEYTQAGPHRNVGCGLGSSVFACRICV